MARFSMRTSIIRRTILLASALPLIFVADFASTYWTNQQMVRGLQEINESNAGMTAISQSSASLNSAMDSLRSFVEKPDAAKRTAITENLKNATRFARMVESFPGGARIVENLEELESEAWDEVKPPVKSTGLAARLLVATQLSLEAEEELRKLQIELKRRSESAFEDIYKNRWLPLVVTAVLDIGFLVLLLSLLVPLLRRLVLSVRNLTSASDRIVAGDTSFQAPVLSNDELGKVTDAFNRVVASLNQNEQDVKARTAAEISRLEFISHTAEELAQSLDLDVVLEKVVQSAVPYLADWSVIDLFVEDDKLHRAAFAHVDPEKEILLKRDLDLSYGDAGHFQVLYEVRAKGTSIVFGGGEGSREIPETSDPERVAKIGVASVVTVPIFVRQNVVGVLTVASASPDRIYGRKEQLLAEDLARRAGYAIENSRLFQEAKLAVQTRDDFLSIASHELRTPLTPLRMQLQMLGRALRSDKEIDPARVATFIDTSDRMVARLTRLVEDLLEVSRINSQRLELRYEDFDLVALLREILSRFQWEIDRAGARVQLSAPEKILGSWDPGKVEQVFVNLLTNALKYGGQSTVEIEVRDEGANIRLSVRDQGIGIATADLERIFQRFERAVNTNTYGGLGLGLYITSQIVELHGGKISVKSEEGKGSTFVVELPKRKPELPRV